MWQPPAEDVFSIEKRAAMDFLRDVENQGGEHGEGAGGNGGSGGEGSGGEGGGEPGDTRKGATSQKPGTNKHVIRKVMDLLCAEASYLVEDRSHDETGADGAPAETDNMAKVDAILKALGIETEDHIEKLVQYFVVDEQTGELISPSEVAAVVLRFVSDHQQTLNTKPRTNARTAASVVGLGVGVGMGVSIWGCR